MTTRSGVVSVAPWLGVALVLLFALHDRFDLVPGPVLILVAGAAAAGGIVVRRRDALAADGRTPAAAALRRRTLIAAALFGAASVALAVARSIVAPKLGLRADVISALVPPLIGWSIFLLLPVGLAPPENGDTVDATPHWMRPYAIAAIAFVGIWLSTIARSPFAAIDEVLYTLQAHRFSIGHATWPLDPELQRFVKLPLMAGTAEGIYTQYPPGYPAVLALFVRLGIPALSGATLGALATLGMYRLGERVATTSVGLLAALLLATNAIVIRWSAVYMSHAAAMTSLCVAAWLALDSTGRSDQRRDIEGVLAGVLLGVAFTIRPVTALAVGLSIWLALLTRRLGWDRLRRVTALMCLGSILPFATLLAYNAATNGNPLQVGYQATMGHLTDLGFGLRGVIVYDHDVRPVVAASYFTFAEAVRNEITSATWPLARDLFPVWWLLPLLAVAIAYRMRLRWGVASFCVLPIINFFHFGNSERFYVELLPFAVLAAALVVRQVSTTDPRAARAVAIFLVGAGIVTSATRASQDRSRRVRQPSASEVLVRALRDSARARPRILVFVRDTMLSEPLLLGLSQFNFGRFPGAVVVARDLRAENARLACRLPGYRVLVAEYAPAARIARLVSMRDTALATTPCDRPALVTTPRPPA